MSSSRKFVVMVAMAGLAGLGGYAWYAQRGPGVASAPTAAPAAPATMAVAVETAEVAVQAMPDEVSAVGTLRSNESVVLRPEVSGRISAIRFEEGQPVARGAVLIELDAAVERAELQQARANLDLARSNYRRTEELFGREFVSRTARDEAASRLAVARAAEQLAQARLERMRILAPFDGIVGIRNVSVGDYVKDGAELVNLEDISSLKVDFRLPEIHLQQLRTGQSLEVGTDTLPGERFAATVRAIDPLVDAQGRAVLVRAALANPDGRLRPGVFARVRLTLAERSEVVVVPEEALMPMPGGDTFVYRVVDGLAQRVAVRIGVRRDARVEIVEGLQAGDVVVTAGQLKLREGVPVRPVEAAGAPAGGAKASGPARAG